MRIYSLKGRIIYAKGREIRDGLSEGTEK